MIHRIIIQKMSKIMKKINNTLKNLPKDPKQKENNPAKFARLIKKKINTNKRCWKCKSKLMN